MDFSLAILWNNGLSFKEIGVASMVLFAVIDILGNIGSLVTQFGNEGLVGIIAAGLVAYLIVRK